MLCGHAFRKRDTVVIAFPVSIFDSVQGDTELTLPVHDLYIFPSTSPELLLDALALLGSDRQLHRDLVEMPQFTRAPVVPQTFFGGKLRINVQDKHIHTRQALLPVKSTKRLL